MTDEIKIWSIDSSSKVVEPIQQTDWNETEGSLEDVLVKNPDMLMPGLTLVGRQTPTDTGPLDLLGIDEDGRLVVFELKRDKPTRDAVAQAIDYCSYLESLPRNDITDYIEQNSGTKGIHKFDDLVEWYYENHREKELSSLRPAKIVIVGLGTDVVAQRMVGFLSKSGVEISLLAFYGYECGERTLLARQVEGGEVTDVGSSSRQQLIARWRRGHVELAEKMGIYDLWQEAVKELSVARRQRETKSGVTFHMGGIRLDNLMHSGSHSVVIEEKSSKIRVTFYPASIHLCWNEFQIHKEQMPFQFEEPKNARPTERVSQQWYCVLNKEDWETHKEMLTSLARTVCNTWEKTRKETAG